ncbi:hypothetical protein ROZALSC1DRAFT_26984 [Rozella allomycis CSF55]|uniref:UBX domain-containing protein n=1 Tax=Rozella allomycis (strain CSF55) TaxID=988480 RepID=A0A075ASX6_ROZAC|nr:hypothetical protein O9G_001626 [Rozella allomycis CSF55]RKP21613.1 hypothetical protein ROZALSC1DRAFT_26984 [Rozella allomycis CSF55]|eukprot:EPZ33275.1 hypothetical protein O9G_001626 [Rozella allomycis CSF55]
MSLFISFNGFEAKFTARQTRQGKTNFDNTITMKSSGLTNAAHVDLVRYLDCVPNDTIELALQVVDEGRVNLKVRTVDSLWDILLIAEREYPNLNFTKRCKESIYMMPFDFIDLLMKIKLYCLGIKKGRILCRLMFKESENNVESYLPIMENYASDNNRIDIKNENVLPANSGPLDNPKNMISENNTGSQSAEVDILNNGEDKVLFDRRVQVFQPSEKGDLPDNFYELTPEEAKAQYLQMAKKRNELENAPLKTKSIREKEIEQRKLKYPKFPDEKIIQATFLSSETLSNIVDFIKCSSTEEDFELFVSPPKRILANKDATLFDMKLVPAALIYVSSRKNSTKLLQSILVQLKSSFLESVKDLPSKSNTETQFTSTSVKPSTKPKWLKLFK